MNLPAPLKKVGKFHIGKLEQNCEVMRSLIGKFKVSFFPVVEKRNIFDITKSVYPLSYSQEKENVFGPSPQK
jgi:hypothetical protein